jgi:hypothetical protein
VKTIEETPTRPVDYAALTGAYSALLAGLALAGRRRPPGRDSVAELAVLGAATFTVARLLVDEKVETWLRDPFVRREPGGGERPRGRRLRYAVGELLTCTRCAGAWGALGVVGLRTVAPSAGRPVTAVLAAKAANDVLQAGFSALCRAAD